MLGELMPRTSPAGRDDAQREATATSSHRAAIGPTTSSSSSIVTSHQRRRTADGPCVEPPTMASPPPRCPAVLVNAQWHEVWAWAISTIAIDVCRPDRILISYSFSPYGFGSSGSHAAMERSIRIGRHPASVAKNERAHLAHGNKIRPKNSLAVDSRVCPRVPRSCRCLVIWRENLARHDRPREKRRSFSCCSEHDDAADEPGIAFLYSRFSLIKLSPFSHGRNI